MCFCISSHVRNAPNVTINKHRNPKQKESTRRRRRRRRRTRGAKEISELQRMTNINTGSALVIESYTICFDRLCLSICCPIRYSFIRATFPYAIHSKSIGIAAEARLVNLNWKFSENVFKYKQFQINFNLNVDNGQLCLSLLNYWTNEWISCVIGCFGFMGQKLVLHE